MRGEIKRKIRARNLRLLQKTYSFKQIAELSGTDEVYLSQIANEVMGSGRKSPRGLSDAYASKIEVALGLGDGWFDNVRDGNYMVNDTPAPYHDVSPAKLALIAAVQHSGHRFTDAQARALAEMIVAIDKAQ